MEFDNVNIKAAKDELKTRLKELERFEKKGTLKGKHYQTCKVCGKLTRRYGNDYSQKRYCKECWDKKLLDKEKKRYEGLVGATIVDIEIGLPYSFRHGDAATIEKLIVEKDGKRYTMKLHVDPIFIL